MDYKERYQAWMEADFLSSEEKASLSKLGEEEKAEAFYQDLAFGTAGLRGIRGLGPNRMNKYVVRKVTQGYASFLKKRFADRLDNGIYITYDCRINSQAFSMEAARVFSANGIKAYVFNDYRSTPQLSFAVREKKAMGGIVMTASHNPSNYNGYKAYNALGCQLSPEEADAVVAEIARISAMDQVLYDEEEKLVFEADPALDAAFLDTIRDLHQGKANPDLSIMMTPLHGVGGPFAKELLEGLGYDFSAVKAQFEPDGTFPTAPKPNPEEEEALGLLIQEGKKAGSDLLLATDPDADRLGVMVRHGGEYVTVTGNQLAALMVHYLLESRDYARPAAIVKSVVSSDFPGDIARDHGLEVYDTLTGFKFIGDQVDRLVKAGRQVVFAFEESIGYLPGDYIRDKDAFGALVLAAEMAGYYKREGKTLIDQLEALYGHYGYYAEKTLNIYLEGRQGKEDMQALMDHVRRRPLDFAGDLERVKLTDYLEDLEGYTKSNVLVYGLKNGSWFAIRPSGTEPKIKVYISCVHQKKSQAQALLATIEEAMEERINLVLKDREK